jgi:predicted RNA-binding protein with PUA-like domain
MRAASGLATMQVLRRGNRLSITPVTAAEWDVALGLLRRDA